MDFSAGIQAYLIAHGAITVGVIIAFVVRVEHRLTKLETTVDLFFKNPGKPKKTD